MKGGAGGARGAEQGVLSAQEAVAGEGCPAGEGGRRLGPAAPAQRPPQAGSVHQHGGRVLRLGLRRRGRGGSRRRAGIGSGGP